MDLGEYHNIYIVWVMEKESVVFDENLKTCVIRSLQMKMHHPLLWFI